MSSSPYAYYQPDPGAQLQGSDYIAQLSQRDLSLTVPIDFVSVPGVSLSTACFGNRRFEDDSAAKCLSNLLATGFRRLDLDVYWDASRHVWSVCPVELGGSGGQFPASSASASIVGQTSASPDASSSELDPVARDARTIAPGQVQPRQSIPVFVAESSAASLTSSAVRGIPTTAVTRSELAPNTSPSNPSGIASNQTGGDDAWAALVQVGPYVCSSNMTLSLLTVVMQEHLEATEDSLNATTKYLILNLHAASPASDPTGPAHEPAAIDRPNPGQLLSDALSSNVSSYLYSPTNLREQRSNLNGSGNWYEVPRMYQPDPAYFSVELRDGVLRTPDGWPSEGYVELQRAKRLLVAFGQVDPQMASYNFTGDGSSIFPPGYLDHHRPITISEDGTIDVGCYYSADSTAVSLVNSSWAAAGIRTPSYSPSIDSEAELNVGQITAYNMTNCGISPVLNTTIYNTTADVDYIPYQQYVLSTVWSWAPGQPINTSFAATGDSSGKANKCAMLNATSGYWQPGDCAGGHYAACKYSSPYNWTITSAESVYAKANAACPPGSSFSAPRTALENTFLLNEWRKSRVVKGDTNDPLLYVNFNDLDVDSCWVIGQNATCPYDIVATDDDRTVIVPTVAAVIVFVLFMLTVFVKCAANRQSTKRRRKRDYDLLDDHEGVPL